MLSGIGLLLVMRKRIARGLPQATCLHTGHGEEGFGRCENLC
jgi:hypothetical protein